MSKIKKKWGGGGGGGGVGGMNGNNENTYWGRGIEDKKSKYM